MWVAVLGIITIIVSFLGLYGEKRQKNGENVRNTEIRSF